MPSSQSFEIDGDGKAKWLNEDVGPTQSQLKAFVSENREKLTDLSISVQHGRKQPSLNFAKIGILPSLKSLLLGGVFVEALSFTSSNTPVLESLDISLLSCNHEDGLRFELALPFLKSFSAEHIMVDGYSNFGLSLSRCPLLETVYTYKFRALRGDNYAILPNCKEITLHRSECTDSLEVVSAPVLTSLSVQAAFSLKNVRLWDIPNEISAEDIEKLSADMEDASMKIGQELDIWASKWRDGTFTGKDAFDRNWIEREDIRGFNFKKHEYMEQILWEDVHRMFQERREMAKERIWTKFVAQMSEKPLDNRNRRLPNCEVNCVNMVLSRESREHLTTNKRVQLVGANGEDDDDMFGMPFGM